MYNLTPNQQALLRSIVEKVKSKENAGRIYVYMGTRRHVYALRRRDGFSSYA
jgi:hypothetical protein